MSSKICVGKKNGPLLVQYIVAAMEIFILVEKPSQLVFMCQNNILLLRIKITTWLDWGQINQLDCILGGLAFYSLWEPDFFAGRQISVTGYPNIAPTNTNAAELKKTGDILQIKGTKKILGICGKMQAMPQR